MAKRAKQRAAARDRGIRKKIYFFAYAILAIKIILILSAKYGGWLGADGESYLKGVDAILKSGLSSKDSVLVYWPAGYPIILWILSLVSISKLIYLVSFVQTVAFFAASLYFVEQLWRTRLSKLALPLVIILGLNPTLSLSSLSIGYESLVASCMLASIALVIQYERGEMSGTDLIRTVVLIGIIQSVSAFMQPRGLLIGFFILLLWALSHKPWKQTGAILVLGICVMLLLPIGLIVRNAQADNGAVISRNLGVTMSLGAGDHATGGYGNSGGVPCKPTPPATVVADSQLVKCTITWYAKHPGKSIVLALKKSVYFWSPWYGPVANGSMVGNPWLKFDPMRKMDTTKQAHDLLYGWFGKVVSWTWLISGLILLFAGFDWLWKMGGLERQIGLLTGVPVVLAWLTAIGTIGDHRFRLPTMGLSLFLQVAGYFGLRERFAARSKRATLEPRGRTR